MLEVSMIHALAGELSSGKLATTRPFRAPHHSASMPALVGGGSRPRRPGEVSLAHLGVLFLDQQRVARQRVGYKTDPVLQHD